MQLITNDVEINHLAEQEKNRLENTLNLIAAESHTPIPVMQAAGSIFNTKTIEGYPGKRFHAGCLHADDVENIAIDRAKKLFGAEYANVQPHSGTSANLAVYFSVLNTGDKILGMDLAHGGHLSHGHTASITSKCFNFKHYTVDSKTEQIDYDNLERMAKRFMPKMIVAGASSYPRLIDYERIASIAEEISAYFLVDMAHIAGIVAAGLIPSPVPVSDFVTFTCYKTMMGARGGVILSLKKYAENLNSSVFPGCQGTSAVNQIAGKAVTFKIALEPKFIQLQNGILKNAVTLAVELEKKGYRIVTGGTDTHQVVMDVSSKKLSGKRSENSLESVGLVTNRNAIPSDAGTPGKASGIRLGTTAVTARGMGADEICQIASLIDRALMNHQHKQVLAEVKETVQRLCHRFPVYPHVA